MEWLLLEITHHSPSALLRKTLPAPLQTQSPASCQPCPPRECQSLLLTLSPSPSSPEVNAIMEPETGQLRKLYLMSWMRSYKKLSVLQSHPVPSHPSHRWLSPVPNLFHCGWSHPASPSLLHCQSHPISQLHLCCFSTALQEVLLCCMDPPVAFQSSAPRWLVDPTVPPQPSKPQTPPQPSEHQLCLGSTLPRFYPGPSSLRLC